MDGLLASLIQPQSSVPQGEPAAQPMGELQPLDHSGFFHELSMTGLGRLQLMNRLEGHFGTEYQDHPQAQAIMQQFEDKLAKNETPDLSALQRASESGRQVYDYLTTLGGLTPMRATGGGGQ